MTVCGFHAASYGAEITASECISTDLSHAPGDTRAGKDRTSRDQYTSSTSIPPFDDDATRKGLRRCKAP
jgi:hypothetical protein